MSSSASAVIIILICVTIIIYLLLRIHTLKKKNRYVDEANMWHRLAITDGLTKAYNRYAYDEQIRKIKESKLQKLYGVLLFDVDDFKKFNDTKGHLQGDSILRRVSRSLLEIFPEPHCKVFRIGGDEFSVICEGVSEKEIIKRLLRLREQLENVSNIRISKGYSVVEDDFDKAFKNADEMLYADKMSKKKAVNLQSGV